MYPQILPIYWSSSIDYAIIYPIIYSWTLNCFYFFTFTTSLNGHSCSCSHVTTQGWLVQNGKQGWPPAYYGKCRGRVMGELKYKTFSFLPHLPSQSYNKTFKFSILILLPRKYLEMKIVIFRNFTFNGIIYYTMPVLKCKCKHTNTYSETIKSCHKFYPAAPA